MAKQTVVLVPGLLCDASVWSEQVKVLQKRFNLIIPEWTNQCSENEMVQHILKHCPDKFCLVGHSMGGWLALALMRLHAHRVDKLCLMATSATLDKPSKKRFRLNCIRQHAEKEASHLASQLAHRYSDNQKINDMLKIMFERNMGSFVSQQQAMLARRANLDILPKIKVDTLVMVGDSDYEFFDETQKIADLIPRATFKVIEQCGHMLQVEQPKACTDTLNQWL